MSKLTATAAHSDGRMSAITYLRGKGQPYIEVL
jgi:hypothetical protein